MALTHRTRSARLATLVLGGLMVGACSTGTDLARPGPDSGRTADPDAVGARPDAASLARLPLSFEANQGQADGDVKFLSRGRGYGIFLSPGEAVLRLGDPAAATSPWALRMRLEGADPMAKLAGEKPLQSRVNYLTGSDPAQWRTNIATFAKARYNGVYPGTDLIFYGSQNSLEYDFALAPGADPSQIAWTVEGARRARLDANGDLVLSGPAGDIRQRAPRIYQEAGKNQIAVPGGFTLRDVDGGSRVGFTVGSYDRSLPLVIDPVINYSTYLGGSRDDDGRDIVVSGGNAYVTGITTSADFPLKARLQPEQPNNDAFVTKLSSDGSRVLWSTYLGGSGNDEGHAIAVADGFAYVTGLTESEDFPARQAFQPAQGGPDAFVTKLTRDGADLAYSTHLGGSAADQGLAVAVADGEAFVSGFTDSANFPTATPYQLDQPGRDAFVTKLRNDGSALLYSTYLGGGGADEAHDIAVADGEAYVTGFTDSLNLPVRGQFQLDQPGTDAFVAKLRGDGTQLVYSTYLGGTGNDRATAIAVADGNAYVTGLTDSVDFPIRSRYQLDQPGTDAFVTKLRPDGAQPVYSTYLGGAGNDQAMAIDVADGNAYVAGFTDSINFPITRNRVQPEMPGYDAFVTKMRPDGAGVVASTYLGGSEADGAFGIAVDSNKAYVTGSTESLDFPIDDRFQPDQPGRDVFVTKVAF